MTRRDPFVEHLLDLLQSLGPVQPRRMFGGWGLYLEGTMFALVADDRLYLKVDDETEARFADADAEPFTYSRPGRRVKMSYREAPDGSLEDPDELLPWARLAVEASRRAKSTKGGKRGRK